MARVFEIMATKPYESTPRDKKGDELYKLSRK
jgi:hypothetical protein